MSPDGKKRKRLFVDIRLTKVQQQRFIFSERGDGTFEILDEEGNHIGACADLSGYSVSLAFRPLGLTADVLSKKDAGEAPEPAQKELKLHMQQVGHT